jgi:hypothetical protein
MVDSKTLTGFWKPLRTFPIMLFLIILWRRRKNPPDQSAGGFLLFSAMPHGVIIDVKPGRPDGSWRGTGPRLVFGGRHVADLLNLSIRQRT